MQRYVQRLLEEGALSAQVISPSSVVTAPWTVYKCRTGCTQVGTNLRCPPFAPSWKETQEMLACFETALLFSCEEMRKVSQLALTVSREIFLDDYYKVIAFASGPCKKCTPCNMELCIHPRESLPSMEACGIDVFATARNNGIELHVLRDKSEPQRHFGLILVD
ncbi:MAG TPA: DUF2284 domain-containing protein [Tissierellia bacterium]|jgi:predicted metal-binding protein|nr:DUF2284 domain-containing protein [Tissierellia bacterium]